ncbi:hypothetical protein IFM89_001213 [Coptis chinensis]|uniref:PPM-type phosphatase domain-containing protein n=1 Tax=Coptis chinensis TaxID=261450 RepID=A0A835H3P3_9MAGN|nr:hypothetical protein IFM89_001213 [Coptis chinensis]
MTNPICNTNILGLYGPRYDHQGQHNKANGEGKFVILASDSLWDVMSNEMACQVIRRCLNGQIGRTFANSTKGSIVAEAAAVLAE